MDAPTLTRSWPALAGVGAGLIQLALGAGAVMSADAGPAARVTGGVLILVGAASFAWSLATLALGRPVMPRIAVAGSLAGIAGCVGALATDPGGISALPVVAASALLLIAGGFCAVELRRTGLSRPAAAGRTGVAGILVGAALVGALVTPALADTEVGQAAPDHSEHSGGHTH